MLKVNSSNPISHQLNEAIKMLNASHMDGLNSNRDLFNKKSRRVSERAYGPMISFLVLHTCLLHKMSNRNDSLSSALKQRNKAILRASSKHK